MNARCLDVALWTCVASPKGRARLRVEFVKLLETCPTALRPMVEDAIRRLDEMNNSEGNG